MNDTFQKSCSQPLLPWLSPDIFLHCWFFWIWTWKILGGVRAKCFLCQKVDSRIKLIPHWITWDVLCTKTPLRRQMVWERCIPCKCTRKLPSKRRILPLQTPTYFKMLKNMSNWIYKKEKVLISGAKERRWFLKTKPLIRREPMTVFKEVCRPELQCYKCELILKGRAAELTWSYVRLIKTCADILRYQGSSKSLGSLVLSTKYLYPCTNPYVEMIISNATYLDVETLWGNYITLWKWELHKWA